MSDRREDWERAVAGLPTPDEAAALRGGAPPKPSRWDRKKESRAEKRAHDVARDKFRGYIFRLDNGRCRCCGRKVWLKINEAPHELAVGHVHEWVKRSQLGDDLDPFNCILLCAECHDQFGNHDNIVPLNADKLMRGEVEFVSAPPLRRG